MPSVVSLRLHRTTRHCLHIALSERNCFETELQRWMRELPMRWVQVARRSLQLYSNSRQCRCHEVLVEGITALYMIESREYSFQVQHQL
jgi:predicted solute-binding protein